MNNTALRARVQSTQGHKESVACSDHPYDKTHMFFASKEHEKFYREWIERIGEVRYLDCYQQSLVYVLGIGRDTREHFEQIYDIKTGLVYTDCLRQGWQTSGSVRAVRLALNLYTDSEPSVDDYRRKDDQIEECRAYSVSDIFCDSYAMYFWEGIKLRYPEYARGPRSMEEILAEMKEREHAENKADGNEKRHTVVREDPAPSH